jgi:hypothetical protein
MNIQEFISLIQTEYNGQRPKSPVTGIVPPIDFIRLSSHLKFQLDQIYGVQMMTVNNILIIEDPNLSPYTVKAVYNELQGDYQTFDFTYFEKLPFGNARLAICNPPVFGSAQLSGVNQYPYNNASIGAAGLFTTNSGHKISISNGTIVDISQPPSSCAHFWKRYNGFTQVYDFCTHCDKKRDI